MQANSARRHTKHSVVLAAQHCTAMVCATRMLDMWAMAEEVMFEADLWDAGRLPSANFLRFQQWIYIEAHWDGFQMPALSSNATAGRRAWECHY